jgi:uncharacterized protein HemX
MPTITQVQKKATRHAAKARAQMGKLQGAIEKRRTKIDRLQRDVAGLEVEIHHLQNQLDRVKEAHTIAVSHLRK